MATAKFDNRQSEAGVFTSQHWGGRDSACGWQNLIFENVIIVNRVCATFTG